MDIKPTYVSFLQAKWLKENGFDLECRAFYLENKLQTPKNTLGNYNDVNWVRTWRTSDNDDTISAPEQWQVVEWLQTNFKIYVDVICVNSTSGDNFKFRTHRNNETIYHKSGFNSRQDAYSAAFYHVFSIVFFLKSHNINKS